MIKEDNLASLKSNVGELEIDKLKNVSSSLNRLKGKVYELDVNELATAPVYFKKSSNAVDKKVAKKDVYDELLKS